MSKQAEDIVTDYQTDMEACRDYRNTLDDKEKMMMGVLNDSISDNTKSKVNENSLQTALIKRTNNTVAQLPSGRVRALTEKDKGKNIMMNLILDKYIIPNAKSQHPLYTKLWMWKHYSLYYGTMDVLVDYIVNDNYVGPDMLLIPRRNGVPEAGRISIDDSERYTVETYVTKAWLESKKKSPIYKNIGKLIAEAKEGGKESDSDKTTYNERNNQASLTNHKGYKLLMRFERDRWQFVNPDTKILIRDSANPNKDDELPIVSMHCFPLLDRYHALSEYERNSTLQKAINSLVNLYLDGTKMSIYPPLKVFLDDIVTRTFKYSPGAKWVLKNNNVNAITQMQFSGESLQSFNSTYGFLKAAIMNGTESRDVQTGANIDSEMGRTPQALKMQQAMQEARTNFDRKMFEMSVERVMEKFVNLVANKQEKPINIYLFGEELKQIKKESPDVVEMFESEEGGKVVVKPKDIKDTKYRYFIDSGSTKKKDDTIENDTMSSVIELFIKNFPGVTQEIQQTGKITIGNDQIDFTEILKRWFSTSGTENWNKIFTENTNKIAQPGTNGQTQQPGQATPPMPPMGAGMPPPMPMPDPQMPIPPTPQPMPMPIPPPQPAMPQQGGFNFESLSPEEQQFISELNQPR